MAPPRNRNRRSSIFSMDTVNIQAQLAEIRRYEQERKDLAYARSLQAAHDQRHRPNQPQAVVAPDSPEVIQNLTFTIHTEINFDSPRGQPMTDSADATFFRPMNVDLISSDSSDEDDVVRQPPHPPARANGDSSSSSESNRSGSEMSGLSETTSLSSNSSVSSDSDNNTQQRMHLQVSNPSGPFVRRALPPTRRIGRVSRQNRRSSVANLFIDNSNQPSTSGTIPNSPLRVGVPEPTWGDCTMCFEVPIQPQGCNRCQQILGCATCVVNWFNTAQPHASCPLCRNKWRRKADVSAMSEIAKKKQRPTAATRRRARAAL